MTGLSFPKRLGRTRSDSVPKERFVNNSPASDVIRKTVPWPFGLHDFSDRKYHFLAFMYKPTSGPTRATEILGVSCLGVLA